MTQTATLLVTTRFALIIDALCKLVAARISRRTNYGVILPPVDGAFLTLIWQRLRRVDARFQSLSARILLGTLAPVRPRRSAPTHADRPKRPPGPRVPRGFGWLLRLVPHEAACYASQLRYLFADPAMSALISVTPRMGRVLRWLCHALGMEASLVSPPPIPAPEPPPVADADPPARRNPAIHAEPRPSASRDGRPSGTPAVSPHPPNIITTF